MTGIVQVVLYKHGVGYFERLEEVEGEGEVHLTFRAQDMNDVLKSLTAVDLDGGTVGSVSYDATEPLSKLLEKVSLNIPAKGGTAALCASLRGARVQAQWGSKELEGQIVGVEEVSQRSAEGVCQVAFLSLLDDAGSLHSLSLRELKQVTFLDEHVRKDLEYYFRTLIHSYKQDTKNLTVHARGEGKRRISLSYTLECPVWKTSYRIMLGEDDKAPFVQGWALVDNVFDEDWKDVRLSLVAGLPISFRHDLYSPRHIVRREVQVEREAAAGPVMAQAAVRPKAMMMRAMAPAFECDAFAAASDPFGAPADPFGAGGDPFGGPPDPGFAFEVQAGAAAAQVISQSLGDLFFYQLAHPVTVLRNQSALVPIVGGEFQGRRVVLYSRDEREQNPFSAVELTNSTDLTLEGGPAVVLEGQAYAGEAMIDTLKPGDRRIISYAVDLGVVVECEHEHQREQVNMISVRDGGIFQRSAQLETRVYSLWNKDKRSKICLLQHPVRSDYKLHDTPEPAETTHSYYRFEVPLEADSHTRFCVRERRDLWESENLRSLSPQALGVMVERGYFNANQREELQRVSELTQAVARLQQQRGDAGRRAQELTKDQERLRENLKALGDAEARVRTLYAEKLEEAEKQFEALATEAREIDVQLNQKNMELSAAIALIRFEVML